MKPLRGVRPTTAKVLESLLAILADTSQGARVLDLFAGTGEVGLRLQDQGAAEVTFVEFEARVAERLRQRLRARKPGQWRLVVGKIPGVLSRLEGRFGLMVADPPYDWASPSTLLPALASLAEPGAVLVVEHHHKTRYDDAAGWRLYRQQKYGETRLSFFRFDDEPTSDVYP